jgi:hypothetical protein
MSTRDRRFELEVTAGITLVLSSHSYSSHQAGGAGLYRNGAQQLAFTGFDLGETRIVKRKSDCCLWFGRTCYEIPRDAVDSVVAFLGVSVQDEQGDVR